MDSYLRRKYETHIRNIEVVHREDLDLVSAYSEHGTKSSLVLPPDEHMAPTGAGLLYSVLYGQTTM